MLPSLTLLTPGNGQAFDPINTPGACHNNSSLAAFLEADFNEEVNVEATDLAALSHTVPEPSTPSPVMCFWVGSCCVSRRLRLAELR